MHHDGWLLVTLPGSDCASNVFFAPLCQSDVSFTAMDTINGVQGTFNVFISEFTS